MRELSLFSGAGGGLLGSKLLGWRCIGYVEWEEYCQKVLAARIEDGFLDRAPIFGDIREFNTHWAERYRGLADIVTAGFPCQPFSVAGKQAGEDDPRNMWPATIDCIRMVRPRYCLLENVSGLLASGYFGTILGDLAESGYDARWRILSAAECGAPHKRDRLWILAKSATTQCASGAEVKGALREVPGNRGEPDNTDGSGEALSQPNAERRNRRQNKQGKGQAKRGRLEKSSSTLADAADNGSNRNPRALARTPGKFQEGIKQLQSGSELGSGGTDSWWTTDPANLPDTSGNRSAARNAGEATGQERNSAEPYYGSAWWATDPADLPDAQDGEPDRRRHRTGRRSRSAEYIEGESGSGTLPTWPTESRVGGMVDELADNMDESRTNEQGEVL